MKLPSAIKTLAKVLPPSVTQKIGHTSALAAKHSPTMLFVTGTVCFAGAIGTAVYSTTKAGAVVAEYVEKQTMCDDLLASGHPDYSEMDHKKDTGIVAIQTGVKFARLYLPTILLSAGALGCFGLSQHILNKRNAGLAAAYATVSKAFDKYRKRVVEEYGEEKDFQFLHETTQSKVEGSNKKETRVSSEYKTPSMYARVWDEFNKNFNREEPALNRIFLSCQQNYANDLLLARGHLFLNEVYDMLGLERTSAGAVVGWVIDNSGTDNFVDFGIFTNDTVEKRMFINNEETGILLDFNVNGLIYDAI